jgi:hypothetical protein
VKNYYNTCYTNPSIDIQPVSNEIPGEFQLYQNYPNPFNSKSKIKNQISKMGMVSLVVYDALGR